MEQRIAIITDSCADIPTDICERKQIYTLPVIVNCDGREYRDGVDLTVSEVFTMMEKGSVPKTSLPPETDLIQLMDSIREKTACTHAVVITMSSAISGTYQMVQRVCSEYTEMTCMAIDSGMAAIAEGALAIELADEIANGLNWDGIEKRIQYLKEHTLPFFGVDTLKYLMRSGRIGKAKAIAGEVLNIKPILSFDETGTIENVDKVRGKKAVINHISDRIIELSEGHSRYRLYFAHSNAEEECKILEKKIRDTCTEALDVIRSNIGCALGAHLGPGLVGAGIQILD